MKRCLPIYMLIFWSVFLSLAMPQGAAAAANITINNVSIVEGNSGTTNFNFLVSISEADTTGDNIVTFTTQDNTATTADSDYVATSGTVTFLQGTTTQQTITVAVTGDVNCELSETFYVKLTGVSGGAGVITDNSGTGTITTDEKLISITNVTKKEGNFDQTAFDFTVSLSADPGTGNTIAVDWATEDGTALVSDNDYQSDSGTIEWSGTDNTNRTITIQVNGDEDLEDLNETFFVKLSNERYSVVGTGGNPVCLIKDTGLGQITNDEYAISITDVTASEGSASTVYFDFTMSLAGPAPAGGITVNYATADDTATAGSDYTAVNSSYTWAAGSNADRNIRVTVTRDYNFEAEEKFFVNLSGPTNDGYLLDGQGLGTILNDDVEPIVSLGASATSILETPPGTATLTATLNYWSYEDVTVFLGYDAASTATLGNDYTRAGGVDDLGTSILIPAGSTTGTVTVTAVDDTVDEETESIIVFIDTVDNGTENVTPQTRTVNITDGDAAPTVTLGLADSPISEEGTTTATYTATLSAASERLVTIPLVYSGTATLGSDYTRAGGVDDLGTSIVIPPGSTFGTVTVTAIDDLIEEADAETIIVSITTSGLTNATRVSPYTQTAAITDNDTKPEVTLSIDGNTDMAENGGTVTLKATLNVVSGLPATVGIVRTGSTAATTDYSGFTSTIVIPAGSLSATKTLTAIDDTNYEEAETIIVTASSYTNCVASAGPQTVTAKIIDDDDPPTVTLSIVGNDYIPEGGGSTTVLTVKAELSGTSYEAVTANLDFSGTATRIAGVDPVDYTLPSWTGTSMTVTAGNLSTTRTIRAVQDTIIEPTETIIMNLVDVDNGSDSGTQTLTASIIDDDCLTISDGDTSPDDISQTFVFQGGTGTITVTAFGCEGPGTWEAISNAPWITITDPDPGLHDGSGTVSYSVALSPEWCVRTGTMTIAGKTFTVIQDAAEWDLGVDYGAAGVWQYDVETGIWVQFNQYNPQKLVMGATDLYGDFGTAPPTADEDLQMHSCKWGKINSTDPGDIVFAGNGVLYGDFNAAGVSKYLNSGTSWRRLAPSNPSLITAGATKFYGWFPTLAGLYQYIDVPENFTGTWNVLTGKAPEQIAAKGETFYGDFGAHGFYQYTSPAGWRNISVSNAENFVPFSDTVVYMDFGSLGLYKWDASVYNSSSGVYGQYDRVSTNNPTGLMTVVGPNLYVNFADGLYKWGLNSALGWSTWTKIDNNQASVMGEYNGKLVAQFVGNTKLYEYNGTAWSEIHDGYTAEQILDIAP